MWVVLKNNKPLQEVSTYKQGNNVIVTDQMQNGTGARYNIVVKD